MSNRFYSLLAAAVVGMTLVSASQAGDQDAPPLGRNKLGFGFEKGLTPGKDYVAGQLIVGIQSGPGLSAKQAVTDSITALGGNVVKEIEGQTILLSFPSEQALEAAAQQLITLKEVRYVERNGIIRIPPNPDQQQGPERGPPPGLIPNSTTPADVRPLSVSNDKGTGYQWHHTVIRKTAALPALSTTPPTVAVIDTGVDYTHTDLAGKVFKGKNTVANNNDPFDDNFHGTHVAGIIAAKAGNKFYGEGVCPNCKILAVKVLDYRGSGSWFDVAEGMAYVVSKRNAFTPKVRVVNMSLGGGFSSAIADQVLAIKNAGMVLAASAGNDNTVSTSAAWPGADPNTAFRVMATEENDSRAYFSNFSPSGTPDQYNIAAPGWRIYSTMPDEGFGTLSGTSMASPVVAGAAALVWGNFPALTRDQVIARMVNNGKLISKGFAAKTRRVDVRKALKTTAETALVGRILDPFTGTAPTPPTTATKSELFKGTTLLEADATNRGGSYEMTGLAAGSGRSLKGSRTGYVAAKIHNNISILSGIVQGPYTDALPQKRGSGYATIVTDWKTTQPKYDTTGCVDTCNGWEFDLFVKTPSGSYIYYYNPGDLSVSPYVRLGRDSYVDYEPMETTVIGPSAENGVYEIFVWNQWGPYSSWNPSWKGSGASVQVYRAAALFKNYNAPPAACDTQQFWRIGKLTKNGTSYSWTNVNACTDTWP
ncbi:MAG: S8 family serine peptidase [Gammaproteobacteria bacterium]